MGGLGMKEEGKGRDGVGGFGRTIVVGVEMDALSKELLTWALVKVAEPGDRVVAVHVLHRRGNYSYLLLLKQLPMLIRSPCFIIFPFVFFCCASRTS